jgi:hypothetical protein
MLISYNIFKDKICRNLFSMWLFVRMIAESPMEPSDPPPTSRVSRKSTDPVSLQRLDFDHRAGWHSVMTTRLMLWITNLYNRIINPWRSLVTRFPRHLYNID